MALEQAREFEEQLKGLFFSSGKIDVWTKIKARAAKMETDAAEQARAERVAAAKKKREMKEALDAILLTVVSLVLVGLITWGGIYFYLHCNKLGCH
jgi:hypothetical protein